MNVLLIEDDLAVADFIVTGMTEEYYKIDHAQTGAAGIELCKTNNYDLVILDLVLPDMDGISVCRGIRRLNALMAVLMLTSKVNVEDKIAGLNSGADDYLTKPFFFEELLARVRSVLRRTNKHDSMTQYKGLVIDPVLMKIYANNVEIPMRPKEYAIFYYLLRNKGLVISREQILEVVWGQRYLANTNVVEVNIKHIREKLSRHVNEELICTIKGKGYIINK
ncbi:MAG: response regulator transcription factor [Candidatus Magnetoovum sp. WYHC-5]|nr:response regulator transcription factor [Candidatus Magnetoovum sp. WYHC-5]